MTHAPLSKGTAPTLRLFDAEAAAAAAESGIGELGPHSTLRECVEGWYVPICCRARRNGQRRINEILRALKWWEELTTNLPVGSIDAFATLGFSESLDEALYHRDYKHRVKPQLAKWKPLKLRSKFNIKTRLNTIFRALGPQVDPEDPFAGILAVVPHIPVRADRRDLEEQDDGPLPPFKLRVVRSIFAAADKMTAPNIAGISPGDWWRGFDGCMVYMGLRLSEAGALRYSMIKSRKGLPYFDVPAKLTKSRRRAKIPIHPKLLAHLEKIRTPRDLIFPWPHCERHLQTCHERLQTLAGVPESDWLGYHGFRRTFAVLLDRLGSRAGTAAAKEGLRHRSEKTTKGHYSKNTVRLMMRFPDLFTPRSQRD